MAATCGSCKYFGWRGLKMWCRHPKYNRELPRLNFHCKEWLDEDHKAVSKERQDFPSPLTIKEGFI